MAMLPNDSHPGAGCSCEQCLRNFPEQRSHTTRLVTVCDKCLMATCWQGTFMCDDAKTAGTVEKTVGELAKLDRENASYWFTDPATGRLDGQALTEYIDQCLGVSHRTDEPVTGDTK